MLVFTCDPVLSLYVVLATVGVMSSLAFFIVVIMGWAIGPLEVIALIVFIGYAVTYSLHIAHKYGGREALDSEPPRPDLDEKSAVRYQRTAFALKSIGSAAMGSAVTTIGCSIFLLFCTLTIFKKLGGVVLAVTIMSIFTAIAPLPAALLMAGPWRSGWRCFPWPGDVAAWGSRLGTAARGEPREAMALGGDAGGLHSIMSVAGPDDTCYLDTPCGHAKEAGAKEGVWRSSHPAPCFGAPPGCSPPTRLPPTRPSPCGSLTYSPQRAPLVAPQ